MADKQFPASIKRLQRARREGKVVTSRMVTVAASWLTVLFLFGLTFAWVRNGTLIQWLNYKVWVPQVAFSQALREGCSVLLVAVSAIACSGLIAGLAQTKCLFSPSQLTQGFKRYKPGAYLGRVRQSGIDVCLGLIRCLVVAALIAPVLFNVLRIDPTAIEGSSSEVHRLFTECIWAAMVRGAMALLVLGLVAYSLVRWRFFHQLRMSLQELKDEFKEDEGDPHAKAARKHEHRALLFAEIEKRVKSAKVIVVRRRK